MLFNHWVWRRYRCYSLPAIHRETPSPHPRKAIHLVIKRKVYPLNGAQSHDNAKRACCAWRHAVDKQAAETLLLHIQALFLSADETPASQLLIADTIELLYVVVFVDLLRSGLRLALGYPYPAYLACWNCGVRSPSGIMQRSISASISYDVPYKNLLNFR